MRSALRCLRFVGVSCAALLLGAVSSAGASPGPGPHGSGTWTGAWSPPVVGPVVRGFDPPVTRFGPGHLGVDYAVAPGTAVRAAGDGVVAFVGRVGDGLHVVVRHDGDVRTTDSFLATIDVVVGQAVLRGAIVGTSGGTGPGHGSGVLHFGVRVGAVPVDPMLLFAPPDLGAVVHLAPPRGGPAASGLPAAATASRAGAERAALADSLRVDARGPSEPPPWWNRQQPAPPVTAEKPGGAPAPPPRRLGATAANARPGSTGSTGAGVAVVGALAGVTFVATAQRRQRRSAPDR